MEMSPTYIMNDPNNNPPGIIIERISYNDIFEDTTDSIKHNVAHALIEQLIIQKSVRAVPLLVPLVEAFALPIFAERANLQKPHAEYV